MSFNRIEKIDIDDLTNNFNMRDCWYIDEKGKYVDIKIKGVFKRHYLAADERKIIELGTATNELDWNNVDIKFKMINNIVKIIGFNSK
tara:strand:- start:106 stop:369 length:264 start_codon:yes stop_codon:yes gene_type:complete